MYRKRNPKRRSPSRSSKRFSKKIKRVRQVVAKGLRNALEQAIPQPLTEDETLGDVTSRFISNLPLEVMKAAQEPTQPEREHIPDGMKQAVLKRDRHRCVVCKTNLSLEVHHYKPVADGGQNTTGNLITLCANHHAAVHAGLVKIKKPKPVLL
jgi:predicted HNH restriction endonuclease